MCERETITAQCAGGRKKSSRQPTDPENTGIRIDTAEQHFHPPVCEEVQKSTINSVGLNGERQQLHPNRLEKFHPRMYVKV